MRNLILAIAVIATVFCRCSYATIIAPTLASYGAACDGVTDDTTAFQNATLANIPILLIGNCTALITTKSYNIIPKIIGDGIHSKIIFATATLSTNLTLLSYAGVPNAIFSGVIIDATRISQTSSFSAIVGATQATGASLDNNTITASSSELLLIETQGINSGAITRNVLTLTNPTGLSQNQAINVSANMGGTSNIFVNNNTAIGTGIFIDGNNQTACRNTVSGWGFGGGITQGSFTTTAGPMTFCNNTISNSIMAQDVNGTAPTGLEIHAPLGTIATGNTITNVCGSGIENHSQGSVISSNTILNAGGCSLPNNSTSLLTRWDNSTFNGNNSVYSNNKGSGTQYGYWDESSSVSGVVVNNAALLSGSVAQYNLNGSNTVVNQ